MQRACCGKKYKGKSFDFFPPFLQLQNRCLNRWDSARRRLQNIQNVNTHLNDTFRIYLNSQQQQKRRTHCNIRYKKKYTTRRMNTVYGHIKVQSAAARCWTAIKRLWKDQSMPPCYNLSLNHQTSRDQTPHTVVTWLEFRNFPDPQPRLLLLFPFRLHFL
jgi:hypothetical protein